MREYITKIQKYLPVEFVDDSNNNFVRYMTSAYIENFEKEKYQFAFTSFHMLFMTFVYKTKWFLKTSGNKTLETDLLNFLNGNKDKIKNFNTLFDFSVVPESSSIGQLMSSLIFHATEIGICKNLVDTRNNCVHAIGKIFYNDKEIDIYISQELKYIEQIQKKLNKNLINYLTEFIDKNSEEIRTKEKMKEWIVSNHFSIADLEILTSKEYAFEKLKSDTELNIQKKSLYLQFLNVAYDYLEIDKNQLVSKFAILKKGVAEKISIDGVEFSTNEIIEKHISEIIETFDNENIYNSVLVKLNL